MEEIKPFFSVAMDVEGLGWRLERQLGELREADVLAKRNKGFAVGGGIGAFLSTVMGYLWGIYLSVDGALWDRFLGSVWSKNGLAGQIVFFALALIVLADAGEVLKNPSWSNSGTRAFAIVAAVGIVTLLLPVWPLGTLLVSVACMAYGTRPKQIACGTDEARLRTDNRVAEYRSFLVHAAAWNETAEFLERMRLKVKHKQFRDPAIAEAAAKGLEAMREEEEFMRNRVAYMGALADQGELGTRPAASTRLIGADPFDVAEPIARMRSQVEKLRELDEKAVASLQVEAGTF